MAVTLKVRKYMQPIFRTIAECCSRNWNKKEANMGFTQRMMV